MAEQNNAIPLARAIDKNNEEARKPPFLGNVGDNDFLENEDTILGTEKNKEFVASFLANKNPTARTTC